MTKAFNKEKIGIHLVLGATEEEAGLFTLQENSSYHSTICLSTNGCSTFSSPGDHALDDSLKRNSKARQALERQE